MLTEQFFLPGIVPLGLLINGKTFVSIVPILTRGLPPINEVNDWALKNNIIRYHILGRNYIEPLQQQ